MLSLLTFSDTAVISLVNCFQSAGDFLLQLNPSERHHQGLILATRTSGGVKRLPVQKDSDTVRIWLDDKEVGIFGTSIGHQHS